MAITKRKPPKRKTYTTLSERSKSTIRRHAQGQPSKKDRAANQQYLTPNEEKALVAYLLRMARNGYPVPVKAIPSLALVIRRQRTSRFQAPATDNGLQPPTKNWMQRLYKRHPELKAKRLKAIDWARHDVNIRDKVVQRFEVIEKELRDPAIRPENVYNMDETGSMLSLLTSGKFVVGADDPVDDRGGAVNRKLITAIECISAGGRVLQPLIIWPAATHRSNWTTHPTPGWHFACSEKGRTNASISLYWIKHVFDPQTKHRAQGRPRVLINDGFGSHETGEIIKFCFENNIVLCRLPSHTSHKLQPCDVGVFGSLKNAYREQVERLYRGGANTIGNQHFTLLYSRARAKAFSRKNIKSGWLRSGLYPFDFPRVLNTIQVPQAPRANRVNAESSSHDDLLPTPVTSENLSSLYKLIEQDIGVLDNSIKHRVQKLRNAAENQFANCALLLADNQLLFEQNNEKTVRSSTRSTKVGEAKIMSYEEIQEDKDKRAAAQEARPARRAKRNGKRQKTNHQADSFLVTPLHKEIEKGWGEIEASGLASYCSILQF